MAAEQAVSVGVGGEAHVELVGDGVVGLVVGALRAVVRGLNPASRASSRRPVRAIAAGGVASCDAALLVGGGAERE